MNSKQTVSREEYRRLDNRVTCILQQRWPASEISQWVGLLKGKQQAVACAVDRMINAAKAIYPLLDVAEHSAASSYYAIIHEYPMTLAAAQQILADKTRHIQSATHGDRDWQRLLPHLHS
ncbi:P22AR C-terminal domain-containing protein [Aeromonas dhakensis]|uniref:P22AR C-terminal domain-containing protein n=1 Tax=Aeromonas dhakensis TaxID=196024 RepID=UPI0006ACB0B2|nr:P22AR C-terminal domain-containing protein [Aeromonas dhakensis]